MQLRRRNQIKPDKQRAPFTGIFDQVVRSCKQAGWLCAAERTVSTTPYHNQVEVLAYSCAECSDGNLSEFVTLYCGTISTASPSMGTMQLTHAERSSDAPCWTKQKSDIRKGPDRQWLPRRLTGRHQGKHPVDTLPTRPEKGCWTVSARPVNYEPPPDVRTEFESCEVRDGGGFTTTDMGRYSAKLPGGCDVVPWNAGLAVTCQCNTNSRASSRVPDHEIRKHMVTAQAMAHNTASRGTISPASPNGSVRTGSTIKRRAATGTIGLGP
ncbi:predicted protein [Plenodomus lingam JN3]|uniref:Predicted protein n=1 Tax=Leptosphaeria maculans (strain JN3 / isolate v23.1.3 / race Av1-4-5-6-7-8) TaxID=985895 RepID=E4ZMR5_LEPMJ|nr:predicted protein [Plenodomus lingam JN3]CBX92518.1 predicted protein [Plenodomus lingam JN3]